MTQNASAIDRLRRFLYTSNEEPRYTTGNPEIHNYYEPEKVKVIQEILQGREPEVLINVVEQVNRENLLPRRETLFIALAFAATTAVTVPDSFKNRLYTILISLCRNDEEFFLFIKYYRKYKKNFPSGLNRVITYWYTVEKDPLRLARNVSEVKGYHGWTHKDLFKLSHCKSKDICKFHVS